MMKKYSYKKVCYLIVFLFINTSNILMAQSYGTWSGNASILKNPSSTYTVSMKLNNKGGTLQFLSLGCAGTITYISGQRGGSYEYRENLNYGSDKSLHGFSIRFSMINNTSMNWEEIDSKGTTLSRGTLTRNAPPPVNIVITRSAKKITPNKIVKCTQGILSVNGIDICNTLELSFDNNKNQRSSIAVGKYEAEVIATDKHRKGVIALKNLKSNVYNLKENGEWKMEQIDRNLGGSIEIHSGNEPHQIKGCILVGNGYEKSDDCFINDSKNALQKIYNDFLDADADSSPNPNIEITVSLQINYHENKNDNNWLLGVISKLEKIRDSTKVDIQNCESKIQRCDKTISKSENIIQLAKETGNNEAEKIATEASIKAKEARNRNSELKNSAEMNLKRIELTLATLNDELSKANLPPQKIISVITNYSGSLSIKKKNGKIIKFEKDQPLFIEKGDEIITYGKSSAELIILEGRGNLKIGENSRLKMEEDTSSEEVMNLIKGKVNINIEKSENYQTMLEDKIKAYKEDLKTVKDELKQRMVNEYDSIMKYTKNYVLKRLEVRTSSAAIADRGTRFIVTENDMMETEVIVLEGSVELKGINSDNYIVVNEGYKGNATKDGLLSEPQKIDLTIIDRWWE